MTLLMQERDASNIKQYEASEEFFSLLLPDAAG